MRTFTCGRVGSIADCNLHLGFPVLWDWQDLQPALQCELLHLHPLRVESIWSDIWHSLQLVWSFLKVEQLFPTSPVWVDVLLLYISVFIDYAAGLLHFYVFASRGTV